MYFKSLVLDWCSPAWLHRLTVVNSCDMFADDNRSRLHALGGIRILLATVSICAQPETLDLLAAALLEAAQNGNFG